jgi:SAM-dependent methyltransferase
VRIIPPVDRDTGTSRYTERLVALEGARWKRWIPVQAPYRWNLRRLALGRTLDVGCGIGRNLAHLPAGSVGVDPNPHSVAIARERGCDARTPEAFRAATDLPAAFDSLLVAHVLEHLTPGEADALVAEYLGRVRPGGRVVLITPQEAGFRSDGTHVTFLDHAALGDLLRRCDCAVDRTFSFPLPRAFGRVFPHNEFVVVGRRSSGASRRCSTSRGTFERS